MNHGSKVFVLKPGFKVLTVDAQRRTSSVDALWQSCLASENKCNKFIDSKLTTSPFSQLYSGFSHYMDEDLFKQAREHFGDILAHLHVDEPALKAGIPTVRFVKHGSQMSPTSGAKAEVYVGGPAALYSAAAAAKLGRKVVFINNGAKGLFQGSARVNHIQEIRQSEHTMSHDVRAMAKYIRRAVLPERSGHDDWHYLKVDVMGPGMFSSIENFRNWLATVCGMGCVVLKSKFKGFQDDEHQNLLTTKSSPAVIHWLQETLDEPILFDSNLEHPGIPKAVGPYIMLFKGDRELPFQKVFRKTMESIGLMNQEVPTEDMLEYYPAARDAILSEDLRGFKVPANGLYNHKFDQLLQQVIQDFGGEVVKGQVDTVFITDDGDASAVHLDNGRTIGTSALLMSLGHVNYLVGASPVTRWQSVLGNRNPVGFSAPGVGVSITGLSLSKGERAPILPTTDGINYHRNVIASKMVGDNVWATLWRAASGGCIGGFIEKDGKISCETFPTYFRSSNAMSKYLFAKSYDCEGIISASACPRQLSSDDQQMMYHSGKNLFIWKGWQGLGIERPPSVAFQHMIQMDPSVVPDISKATGIAPEILVKNKFGTKDITARLVRGGYVSLPSFPSGQAGQ